MVMQRHRRQGNSRVPHKAGESVGQAWAEGNHQQPPCPPDNGSCLCLSQTNKFLNPEDVLKGLQGEPQETLQALKLAISITEKFFESYSTYCSDLMPKLFQVGAGMVQEHLTPCTPAPD